MFARIRAGAGPAVKAVVGAVGVSGTIGGLSLASQEWQAHITRNRIKNRIIHGSFSAEKPKVEIPRKDVQATMKRLLDPDDRSPLLLWGNHQSGKSFALFKACEEAGIDKGIVHVTLDSDQLLLEDTLCKQLGAPGRVEIQEALKEAAKVLGRWPILVLEITRKVGNQALLGGCSGLAKSLCYDKRLAKVVVLASSASLAVSFDADEREVRFQVGMLSEEELKQKEVEEFLKYHGGEVAVSHKSQLIHLTGGNVGKLEDLAKNLKSQTFEEVKRDTIDLQKREILDFLGIDNQGGFGPKEVKAAKEVARRVADAPFHQCIRSEDFNGKFKAKHLAAAVKAQDAHCIYVKSIKKGDQRYCAASPSVHALLKQMAPKPKSWGMF